MGEGVGSLFAINCLLNQCPRALQPLYPFLPAPMRFLHPVERVFVLLLKLLDHRARVSVLVCFLCPIEEFVGFLPGLHALVELEVAVVELPPYSHSAHVEHGAELVSGRDEAALS